MKIAYFGIISLIAIACSGCATQEPQIIREHVPVISSKPYRFIKIDPKEDVLSKPTLQQISRHNATHWRVKQAEKKAKAQ